LYSKPHSSVKFIIEEYLRRANTNTGLEKNAEVVAGTVITTENN